MRASTCTGYYLTQDFAGSAASLLPLPPENLEEMEELHLKLTRHNGRSGKHGAYNPRHNDRRFDVENSEHIDSERAKRNVYWDCYRGYTTGESREDAEQPDFSFEEIELIYYTEHYGNHIDAQNARNEKTRHTERNRTVADLLKNSKTCPEESIYQIGTMDESVPPEVLAQVAAEFFEEFERRFGSHIHIIDWAIHLDEGTPHIHERHVFDCKNRYGELCPQQEKALEELEIPLPNPDKPKGRNNNRKQTFDAICRTMLFDITRRHGLHLEQEPSYGGREYLEKQDYILMKQKEQMERQAQAISDQQETISIQTETIRKKDETIREQADAIEVQGQKLEALTLKIEDVETLLDDVADLAYDKAVELVAAEVKVQTHQEDIKLIEGTKSWLRSPERKASQKERDYALARLDVVIGKIKNAMQTTLDKLKKKLLQPEVKQPVTEQIKERARTSIIAKLKQGQEDVAQRDAERKKQPKQKRKQEQEL